MELASTKILLVAFKSAGAPRENICEQMCRKLAAEHPDRVDWAALDTGPDSESQLLRYLASDPAGVLLTHEDGSLRWQHFHIEDHAIQLEEPPPLIPANLERGLGSVPMPSERTITSMFADEARAALGATRLMEMITAWGTAEQPDPFWCNRAYYHALEWGQLRQKPVLFVRLASLGPEESKLTPLRGIVELMIKKANDLGA